MLAKLRFDRIRPETFKITDWVAAVAGLLGMHFIAYLCLGQKEAFDHVFLLLSISFIVVCFCLRQLHRSLLWSYFAIAIFYGFLHISTFNTDFVYYMTVVFSSYFLLFECIRQIHKMAQDILHYSEESLKEKDLWKMRFDSLSYKMEKDKKIYEDLSKSHQDEVERLKEIFQEKKEALEKEVEDVWNLIKEADQKNNLQESRQKYWEEEKQMIFEELKQRRNHLNQVRTELYQKELLLMDEQAALHRKVATFQDPRRISFPRKTKRSLISIDALKRAVK